MAVCIGCGLQVNDESGLLEVHLAEGGGLTCDDEDGLSITPGFIAVSTANTNCVGLTGNGTAGSPLTPAINLSEQECNSLQCLADGLYAPCHDGVAGAYNENTGAIDDATIIGEDNDYNYPDPSAGIAISNPTCCEVSGIITVKMGNISIEMPAENWGYGFLSRSIDGGAFAASNPVTDRVVHNHVAGSGVLRADINGLTEINLLTIPAGGTVTYRAQFTWQQVGLYGGGAGSNAHIFGDILFEYNWVLVHTACCDHAA